MPLTLIKLIRNHTKPSVAYTSKRSPRHFYHEKKKSNI